MTKRWVGDAAALLLLLAGAAVAGEDGESAPPPILDERGWLTCRAFAAMSPGLQSAFLMGLREGWQTSAAGLDAHATREDLPAPQRASLREGAVWMRRLIDHRGLTYGQMLERTVQLCERSPDSTASMTWLDAIQATRKDE